MQSQLMVSRRVSSTGEMLANSVPQTQRQSQIAFVPDLDPDGGLYVPIRRSTVKYFP